MLYIALGLMFLINLGLVVYFIYTFERLFIIMKAGSLKDLLTYKKEIKFPTKKEEEDEYMP